MSRLHTSADDGPATARRPGRMRVLVALLTLLLVGLGVRGYWFPPDPAGPLIVEGEAALQAGDFRTARRLALQALEHGDSAEAHYLSGRAAMAAGQFTEALKHLEAIPDEPMPLAAEARCDAGDLYLLHFKRLAEAEALYRRALRLDPMHHRAHDHLAFALGLGSRNWELIPHRLALIQLGHVQPLHLYLLCLGESALENDNLVHTYVQTDQPAPFVALSRLAYEAQEYDQAVEMAQRAIAIAPQMVEAHVKLGRALLDGGGSQAALRQWQQQLPPQAEAHPGIWAVRASWAERGGQTNVARRCYWEVLRLDANHPAANYQLGRLLAAEGRHSEARSFLHRAQQLQHYLNLVKVAIEGESAADAQAAAEAAGDLGLVWESFGWHRVALDLPGDASGSQAAAAQLSEQFAVGHPPQRRNRPDVNPAQTIELSSDPADPAGADFMAEPATAAQLPPGEQNGGPRFEDQAAALGLRFEYFNSGRPREGIKRMYEFTGGGIGVVDFDHDTWPDLYATQGCRWPPEAGQTQHLDSLFRNLGGERFEDVAEQAGIHEAGFGQGVTVGDYDNDGFADVYVANIGGNRFWRNNGDGTFSDVTSSTDTAGDRWTSSCLLVDLNHDALPDLYAVNYLGGERVFTAECKGDSDAAVCMPQYFPAAQDQVYLNQGDGRFEDVTGTSGIVVENGKGLGIVAGPFQAGGPLSLFIANDSEANFFFQPPAGDSGRLAFEEAAFVRGVAMNAEGKAEACMGVAAGDADGDGALDLYVTNFYLESNTLYRGSESGFFEDATRSCGLRDPSMFALGFGTQFLDVELDGDLDLMVTNGHIGDFRGSGTPYTMPPQFYRNNGGGRFMEARRVSMGAYFQHAYLGRAVARCDWNRDGRDDLAVGHLDAPLALLTNQTPAAGRCLSLQMIATRGSRDAIGAVARATSGGVTRSYFLTAGDGYQASNQRCLAIAAPGDEIIQTLEVRWPSGAAQVYTDVVPGRHVLAVEGRSELFVVP